MRKTEAVSAEDVTPERLVEIAEAIPGTLRDYLAPALAIETPEAAAVARAIHDLEVALERLRASLA